MNVSNCLWHTPFSDLSQTPARISRKRTFPFALDAIETSSRDISRTKRRRINPDPRLKKYNSVRQNLLDTAFPLRKVQTKGPFRKQYGLRILHTHLNKRLLKETKKEIANLCNDRKRCEEMMPKFFVLGKEQWHLYIDEDDHRFGPMVYDEGTHDGTVEKGYLECMEAGALFTFAHLNKTFSIEEDLERYIALNEIVYGHDDDGGGNLRCREPEYYTQREMGDYSSYKIHCGTDSRHWPDAGWSKVHTLWKEINHSSLEIIHYFEGEDVPGYYGCRKITQASQLTEAEEGDLLTLFFIIRNDVTKLVEKIFKKYKREIPKARTRHQKLKIIAEKHQNLERLHPFVNGNTRTNLIELYKDLVENNFTPCLLPNTPNKVYFNCNEQWIKQIRSGLEKVNSF